MRTGNEHDRRPRVRVFSTGPEFGRHAAAEVALERPEVFWTRKAKEDATAAAKPKPAAAAAPAAPKPAAKRPGPGGVRRHSPG
jgi:hypothetical protein